jgi:hypothetical protein
MISQFILVHIGNAVKFDTQPNANDNCHDFGERVVVVIFKLSLQVKQRRMPKWWQLRSFWKMVLLFCERSKFGYCQR